MGTANEPVRVLVTLAILLAGSTVGTLLAPAAGTVAVGASLLALVGWLAPRDVARRTIHGTGLPRFAAAAMLAGYAWLGAAGLAWVAAGVLPASGHGLHDVVVHAVFLGFAGSNGFRFIRQFNEYGLRGKLALVGGMVGCVLAYQWNGYTTATMGFETFSEIVFQFAVTPRLVIEGLVFAVIVGIIGTFLPAIRASRLPVIEALKAI